MRFLLALSILLLVAGSLAFEDYHRYFSPQQEKREAPPEIQELELNPITEPIAQFFNPPFFINPPAWLGKRLNILFLPILYLRYHL